jgi:hypothetical protein
VSGLSVVGWLSRACAKGEAGEDRCRPQAALNVNCPSPIESESPSKILPVKIERRFTDNSLIQIDFESPLNCCMN